MRIDEARGFGEAATIDEAGVVFRVAEYGVPFFDEGGNYAGIGGKAGGEYERGFCSFEFGEAAFEGSVRFATAADEWASATAPPFPLRGGVGSGT